MCNHVPDFVASFNVKLDISKIPNKCRGVLGTLGFYKRFLSNFYPHSQVKTQIPNEKSKIQNPLLFRNSLKTPLEAKFKLKLEDLF